MVNTQSYIFLILTGLCLPLSVLANDQDQDLFNLTLEDLMEVRVTIASKRDVSFLDNPAAVYVLSSQQIERSGVAHLADALTLIPGVQVHRVNFQTWAVSIRGHASEFSGKLLVLMDGRTLYSPHFAGVYWNLNDIYLPEIDRIEVIRGPGAALWGANAVNGVINIITKRAEPTQHQATFEVGNYQSYQAGGQWSHAFEGGSGSGAVRFFAKKQQHEGFQGNRIDLSREEQWRSDQLGWRANWRQSEQSDWFLSAGFFRTEADEFLLAETYDQFQQNQTEGRSDHLLIKRSTRSEKSKGYFQFFYQDIEYDRATAYQIGVQTLDWEWQLQQVHGDHHLVMGAGYRYNLLSHDQDRLITENYGDGDGEEKKSHYIGQLFFQDSYTVTSNLTLIAGAKIERSRFDESMFQPTLRGLWSLSDANKVWAAVSIAKQSSSPLANYIEFFAPTTLPGIDSVGFNAPVGELASETLTAYELGWRITLSNRILSDLSLFTHHYRDYFGYYSRLLTPPEHTEVSAVTQYGNSNDYRSYGLEWVLSLALDNSQLVEINYQYLDLDPPQDSRSIFERIANPMDGVPAYTGFLHDQLRKQRLMVKYQKQISDQMHLHVMVNAEDRESFKIVSIASPVTETVQLDNRLTLDLSLQYSVYDHLTVSLTGVNLFGDNEPELGTQASIIGANDYEFIPTQYVVGIKWKPML